jgi:hypothetical protein
MATRIWTTSLTMKARRRDRFFTTYYLFILRVLVLSFPLIIFVTAGEGEVFLTILHRGGLSYQPLFLVTSR